jgi:hypothetical protein
MHSRLASVALVTVATVLGCSSTPSNEATGSNQAAFGEQTPFLTDHDAVSWIAGLAETPLFDDPLAPTTLSTTLINDVLQNEVQKMDDNQKQALFKGARAFGGSPAASVVKSSDMPMAFWQDVISTTNIPNFSITEPNREWILLAQPQDTANSAFAKVHDAVMEFRNTSAHPFAVVFQSPSDANAPWYGGVANQVILVLLIDPPKNQ